MIVLPLSRGAIAVIDDCDYKQAAYVWHAVVRGKGMYAVRRSGASKRPVYLHREIMGKPPEKGMVVDHINGRGVDCRRENMRWVSHRENIRNTSAPRNSTSGFKGVCRRGKCKWRAYIMVDDKQIGLGVYSTKDEAIKARLEAEEKLFGIQPRREALFNVKG